MEGQLSFKAGLKNLVNLSFLPQLKAHFTESKSKNGGVSTPHDVEINSQKFDEKAEKTPSLV